MWTACANRQVLDSELDVDLAALDFAESCGACVFALAGLQVHDQTLVMLRCQRWNCKRHHH